jgi:uncharacterized protein involved in cysteine biosynthesis
MLKYIYIGQTLCLAYTVSYGTVQRVVDSKFENLLASKIEKEVSGLRSQDDSQKFSSHNKVLKSHFAYVEESWSSRQIFQDDDAYLLR